ncbi:hypothetical protein EEL30_22730 [Brevibacillus laterosporus]|uniref:Uncharacterized protein n=1 Tax=Brevibacillus laterosporus TaxID=1465 RepID=A0A518VCX8_BRELA|nr:hypothetical protein EEL30_22730 [Brevibacillus laterosporus]
MNKIASKWLIGALAVAAIAITVSFMLIQKLAVDKHDNKHDVVYQEQIMIDMGEDTRSPEEKAEAEQRYNELKGQGLIQETVNPDGTTSATFGGQ